MTDKKLTDSEIKKALECCVLGRDCHKCPLNIDNSANCFEALRYNSLDLINRLQEKDETRHKVFETKCEELEIDQEGDFVETGQPRKAVKIMRDRLTKRSFDKVYINESAISREDCEGEYGFHFCQYEYTCGSLANRKCPVLRIFDKLAYYEDLEEQGKMLLLPCRVGDTIWVVWSYTKSSPKGVYPVNVYAIRYDNKKNNMRVCVKGEFKRDKYDGYYYHSYRGTFTLENVGKTVFLTKEEAEAKLKECEQV